MRSYIIYTYGMYMFKSPEMKDSKCLFYQKTRFKDVTPSKTEEFKSWRMFLVDVINILLHADKQNRCTFCKNKNKYQKVIYHGDNFVNRI